MSTDEAPHILAWMETERESFDPFSLVEKKQDDSEMHAWGAKGTGGGRGRVDARDVRSPFNGQAIS